MTPALDPVLEEMDRVVATAARHLAGSSPADLDEERQPDLYELAFLASEAAALRHLAAARDLPPAVRTLAGSRLVRSARARLDGRRSRFGLADGDLDDAGCRALAAAGRRSEVHAEVLRAADEIADLGLSDDLRLLSRELMRLGGELIEPVAEPIHREDRDLPDEMIDGLAALGVFGLSIPPAHGGSQDPERPDHLPMVVATEVLSRFSLVSGSLITRPEILARALLAGGTEAQRERWLPAIASGERLVAVAVTEPDVGSDVAALRLQARPHTEGWSLRGPKTWSTFAGRADLLMVLARTEPDPSLRHRGLSLFVVEKPRRGGRSFEVTQPGGGSLEGRAIPTIGYRGMHSFEVVFHDWVVPPDALVGGSAGRGRGFHLQMEGFAAGRLQTAARAVGLMQAAFEAARHYAGQRSVFGRRLGDYGLTTERLAEMLARTASDRLFTYEAARHLTEDRGQIEAAMVKCLACRGAEEITRDAMQLHGGYGYAEEYAVSRLFVDARVLTIFEGTEEVLALKVIGRHLLAGAG